MSKRNYVYLVSHKEIQSLVRWVALSYITEVIEHETEDSKVKQHFRAEVRLTDGDTYTFEGEWEGGDIERMIHMVSINSELVARELNNAIVEGIPTKVLLQKLA